MNGQGLSLAFPGGEGGECSGVVPTGSPSECVVRARAPVFPPPPPPPGVRASQLRLSLPGLFLSPSFCGIVLLKITLIQCTSLTQLQTLVRGRWRTQRCFLEGAAAAAATLCRFCQQEQAASEAAAAWKIIHLPCSSSHRLLPQHLPLLPGRSHRRPLLRRALLSSLSRRHSPSRRWGLR